MAIIESLDLEVCLMVRGQPLPEYDDTDTEAVGTGTAGDTIVSNKYVEVQDGEDFYILLRSSALSLPADSGWATLNAKLFIDGSQGFSALREYDTTPGRLRLTGKMDYPPGSAPTLKKFRFSAITVVEDADPSTFEQDLNAAKSLGNIRVEVFKAQALYSQRAGQSTGQERRDFTLSEKALKGQTLSHATGYSAPVPKHGVRQITFLKQSQLPLAVFNFKYRSRDALRSQLIIPSTPRAGSVDNVDELSMEELREIARQHRQQLKKRRSTEEVGNARIKRESDEIVDITGEQTVVRPRIMSQQDSQAVIDLTEE